MNNQTIRHALAFLALILQITFSFGQNFYETKFRDTYGYEYLGFMVYYSENNCYMRVAFTQSNVYNVVNVEYESHTTVEDGINCLLLYGSNPRYITSGSYGTYYPEHFIWVWEENGHIDKPFYTIDPDFNLENLYVVEYFRELSLDQLSEEYLRQFYAVDEGDYMSFMAAIYRNEIDAFISNWSIDEKPTLHLMVVADTEDPDIGFSCALDKRKMTAEFEGIAQVLDIGISKHIIDGEYFSKQNVLSVINQIQPNPNDVILFYYSGHGFRWRNQDDGYPQLFLKTNKYDGLSSETSMSLASVYQTLVTKGARLTIVLGDCCNSEVQMEQVTNANFLTMRATRDYQLDNLSELILNSSGSVIATAASPGEAAYCNQSNGGFFTNSFLQAFRQEIGVLSNDEVKWDDILNYTGQYTKQKASETSCSNCEDQNVLMYAKVSK
jgi:hypothetical protein